MFNVRTGIGTFAFDPSNPKRIYAGNAALSRSDDGGRTWLMLFPIRKGTVQHRNGDHGDYSLTSNDGNYVTGLNIRQIVVDPKDSNLVHIAFSDPRNGGTTLLVSKNSGASFRYEHEFPSDSTLLLAYPGGERLAIGTQGIYYGRAGASKPIAGPEERIAHASAGGASGRMIVYATTQKGDLFVSRMRAVIGTENAGAGPAIGRFEAVARLSAMGGLRTSASGGSSSAMAREHLQRYRQDRRRGHELGNRLPGVDPCGDQSGCLLD